MCLNGSNGRKGLADNAPQPGMGVYDFALVCSDQDMVLARTRPCQKNVPRLDRTRRADETRCLRACNPAVKVAVAKAIALGD